MEKELMPEERIQELENKVEALTNQLHQLKKFYSEIEVDLISSSLPSSASSDQIFCKLVNNYIQGHKSRSKYRVAKLMKITHGRLYELMNGKRALTDDHVEIAHKALALNQDELSELSTQLEQERQLKLRLKKLVEEKLKKSDANKEYKLVCLKSEDKDHINHWMHYAILSLFELENLSPTREGIADCLNTSRDEVNVIIDQLLKANSLIEIDGKLIYNFSPATMSYADDGDRKENFKKLTLGQIDKAKEVYLELNIPFENNLEAGYSGFFFAGDKSKTVAAARMLEESNIKVAKFLAEGKKDCLFSLSFQLAPLNRKGNADHNPAALNKLQF